MTFCLVILCCAIELNALAVFTGIALGGVSGVEMVIGGGFDLLAPAAAYEASAPRRWFDRPVEAGQGWLSQPYSIHSGSVTPTSYTFIAEYPLNAYADEAPSELAGGPHDRTAPNDEPVVAMRTTDFATNADPAVSPGFDATYDDTYEREMAAIEARVAQALGDEPYAETVITPELAPEAYETASPL